MILSIQGHLKGLASLNSNNQENESDLTQYLLNVRRVANTIKLFVDLILNAIHNIAF